MNLYRDSRGEKLESGERYDWDNGEMAFQRAETGEFGADEIKMLRLMSASELGVVRRVKVDKEMIQKVLGLARIVGKV